MKQKTIGKEKKTGLLTGKIAAFGADCPETIVGEVIVSPPKGSSAEGWQKYLKAIRTKKNLIAIAKQVEVEALMLAPNRLLAIVTAIGGINAHGFKIAREQLVERGQKRQAVITQVSGIMDMFKTGDTMEIVLEKKKDKAFIAKLP